MKKLYTITMMLVMMLTSNLNLFSQVPLPYSVNNGTDFFSDWDNSATFYIFPNTVTITESPANPYVDNGGGFVKFTTGNYNPPTFESRSILEINQSNFSIEGSVNFQWIDNIGTAKLFGSVNGIDGTYVYIDDVISNTPFTFDNTFNDYRFLKIQFNSLSGKSTVNLNSFSIYPTPTTSIETSDISKNYNVYSYNKNLVVKSNDFEDYTVTVYNLSGQVVFNKTTNGNDEFTLNVSDGMYIVNVNDGTESFNKKIVIQ